MKLKDVKNKEIATIEQAELESRYELKLPKTGAKQGEEKNSVFRYKCV